MDPVTTVARQAWLLVQQLSKGLEDALEQAMHLSLPVQACLCDVWHDHVLFTGAQVTGLIDYGSVKDDHISVDLARLLGSLAEDDETLWQAGLSAYAAIKPLSNEDIDRVRWLDRTGVLVGVVNWLVWLYRENRPFEHRQAVAERLGRLVKRIGKWLK